MYYAPEAGQRRSDAFPHRVYKYLTEPPAIPTIRMPKAAPAWAPGGRPTKESSDVRSPHQLPRNSSFLDPWSGSGLGPAGDRAGRRIGGSIPPIGRDRQARMKRPAEVGLIVEGHSPPGSRAGRLSARAVGASQIPAPHGAGLPSLGPRSANLTALRAQGRPAGRPYRWARQALLLARAGEILPTLG